MTPGVRSADRAQESQNLPAQGAATPSGLFVAGHCDRCELDMRLDKVLGQESAESPAGIASLRAALRSTDSPRQVIRWLTGTRSAKMLADLAAAEAPLTHELLDSFPLGHIELYVRAALVNGGLLPARHDEVESVAVWLDHALADHPQEARLLRPFTHWVLLRWARKQADRRGRAADYAGRRLRVQVSVALEFLTWLGQRRLTVAGLTQEHVDAWLTRRSVGHQLRVGPFLNWAAQRGLTDKHAVPSSGQRIGAGEILLTEEQRWQQLRDCLTDDALPLEARAAGALALQYGLTLTQIRRLQSTHIDVTDRRTPISTGTPCRRSSRRIRRSPRSWRPRWSLRRPNLRVSDPGTHRRTLPRRPLRWSRSGSSFNGVVQAARKERTQAGSPHSAAGYLKDKVVGNLAQRSGLGYAETDELIHAWAGTSSDSMPRSVAMQMAAAEKFGLEPTPFRATPPRTRNTSSRPASWSTRCTRRPRIGWPSMESRSWSCGEACTARSAPRRRCSIPSRPPTSPSRSQRT
jgi:hypothetical protein